MKKILITAFIFLFSFLFISPKTFNVARAVECDDNSPTGKPVLISAISSGDTSVTLTWTEAQDPFTHYLLAFGRTDTEVEYGSPNIGPKGTTTYTVNNLVKGVKYYFKIRPVNGCRTGDYSNKLPAIPGQKVGADQKVINNVVKTPNLSIYKPVLGANVPTATPAGGEIETLTTSTPSAPEPTKCGVCMGWQLLIAEIALLISYFILTKRFKFLKEIYSILIPVGIYVVFSNINQGCSPSDFSCKYFIPLNVIFYMLIVIIYKNKYLNLLKREGNKK